MTHSRFSGAVLLLAALFGLLWASSALAEPFEAARVRAAAQELAKNADVQWRLPTDSGTAAPTPREGDNWGAGRQGIYIPGAQAIFGLLQWAMIVVAVIALLAVLAILIREPLQARFLPVTGPPLPLEGEPPPPPDPRELLTRADRLAEAGQFAEAMHCVLLAAMIIVGGTADSQTSWELLRAAKLAPPQRSALRDLVIRVERAWFGQRPAGIDDYRHVRGVFDAFQQPSAETA